MAARNEMYLDGSLLQSQAARGDVNDADSSVAHVGAIFRDGAEHDGFRA